MATSTHCDDDDARRVPLARSAIRLVYRLVGAVRFELTPLLLPKQLTPLMEVY